MRKLHPHQQIEGLSGLTIEDFWIWAYSDLLTNVIRNAFAEFIVGFALARLHNPKVGQESRPFVYRERVVEVKAASYVQSDMQNKRSKINFDISIKQHMTNTEGLRNSDCYVFGLFDYDDYNDKDGARNALIKMQHWVFYVLPTSVINQNAGKKKTVGVRWMEKHCPDGPVQFSDLKRRIDTVLGLET